MVRGLVQAQKLESNSTLQLTIPINNSALFSFFEINSSSSNALIAVPVMAAADPVILLLTVLVAPTIIILLVSKLLIHGKKKGGDSKLPPGDMGWPIVGSTFSLFKRHPATTLSDFLQLQLFRSILFLLSQITCQRIQKGVNYLNFEISNFRYGKIFTTRFLGKTIVISADPEFNYFILQNELRLFQNDLPSYFKTLLGEDNLSFMAGETYRRKKSLVHGFFNSCHLPTSFLAEVEEAAQKVMTAWRQKTLILATEEISKVRSTHYPTLIRLALL
jgi:steroid 22-alpha-hydroxylase